MRGKRILTNAVCEFINQLFIIIRGFVVPRLIIGIYGSNINGLVISITNFLSYIVLFDIGLDSIIKYNLYKPIANNDKDKIESILLTTNKFFKLVGKIFILYVLILLIIYPLFIVDNFSFGFIDKLILVISISIFFDYYFGFTYKIYLQALGKAYLISLINIITTIIYVIMVILLVNNNCSIIILKLLSSIILVINPLFYYFYVKKKYKINLKNVKKEYEIKNKYDTIAQHIAWVIHTNVDVGILTLFSTLINVSIYSVYSMVCLGMRNLVKAITNGADAIFGNMIAKEENDNLKDKFDMYEIIYFSIIVVLFLCTFILIIPFISIYTSGINDANYINYTFGFLIVLAEYIYAIRLPYKALIYAGGHFKENIAGAIIECLLNIILSIILVFKLGLIGVSIGTVIAMLVRTTEYIYFSNKYILKRSIWYSIKKILLLMIETIMIIMVSNYIPYFASVNYFNFMLNGFITFGIIIIIVVLINIIFYKNKFKKSFKYLRNGIFSSVDI